MGFEFRLKTAASIVISAAPGQLPRFSLPPRKPPVMDLSKMLGVSESKTDAARQADRRTAQITRTRRAIRE
jgi:hypothetical protein